MEETKKQFSKKSKAVIILLVIFIFLIPVIIYFYMKQNVTQIAEDGSSTPPQYDFSKADIYFDSPGIRTQINTPASININVNSQGKPITDAVISVSFNPGSVSNVSIEQFRDPNSALANTFENSIGEVDYEEGVAWIVLSFPENVIPQPGTGAVARVTFTPTTNTILNFSDNTALVNRQSEDAILSNLSPLNVQVTNGTEQTSEFIPL